MKAISNIDSSTFTSLEEGSEKPESSQPFITKKRNLSLQFFFGGFLFFCIVVCVCLAPVISSHLPNEQNLKARLQPPSSQHPLGTDTFGRDVLARVLHGGRFSLLLSSVVVVLTACVGTALGMMAGRTRGWLDEGILRLLDLFIALPSFAVALVLAALFKADFWVLVLALSITGWTPYARLARAVCLELNSKLFLEAAQALGGRETHLILWHIFPNTVSAIIATVFLRFGHTLLSIAGLSFLGLGAQPPTADWGLMLAEARPYMQRFPLLVLVPGLSIFLTSLSVTFIGHGLQKTLRARNFTFHS
jgi:peptide/nickel transport system permease protein